MQIKIELEDECHTWLKEKAQKHRRTMGAELNQILSDLIGGENHAENNNKSIKNIIG